MHQYAIAYTILNTCADVLHYSVQCTMAPGHMLFGPMPHCSLYDSRVR